MPNVRGYGKGRKIVRRKNRRSLKQGRKNTSGSNLGFTYGLLRNLIGDNPFPTHMRRTHTYNELFTLTTGSGVTGTQQAMRLNSVYDPNYTGAGHQAYGFDQMAALYEKYRVDNVKFQLLFTTPGATNDIFCAAAVAPNFSSGMTGAAIYWCTEQPNSFYGQLSSSGQRRCVLQGNINLAQLCGVPKVKYISDPDYSSAVTTNPAEDIALTFAIACYDGTNAVACQVHCVMSFDVYWFDRTTQPAS